MSVKAPSPPALDPELERLLKRMRMPYVRKAAPEVLATATAQRWEPAEVLRVLLSEEGRAATGPGSEIGARHRAFRPARPLRPGEEGASPIPAATQQALRSLEWISRGENLCVCGPSGSGKSHFVEALGHEAIDRGKTVAWRTLESLELLVRRHRADDTVTKAISRLIRADLVIVDDVGMLPVSGEAAEALFRLVDAAYERRSLALTSNIHPSKARAQGEVCAPTATLTGSRSWPPRRRPRRPGSEAPPRR